ncbi:cytochrome c oxidase subunit II [Qipengyuania sediminis]|uniref:cytochrome c oxidase subunit II n=1 Tax=Qipengyuania sediminis TaxID=1532023 RepID=UPI0010592354
MAQSAAVPANSANAPQPAGNIAENANQTADTAANAVSAQGQPAAAAVAQGSKATAAAGSAAYTPMKPTPGIGMPVDGGLDVQKQFSPSGRYAFKFHTALLWVMGLISLLVLVLLLYVMVRFRAKAHPVPSRTTHNTALEVAWTLVPVLILIGIAIPSISLLSQQYRSPPKDAITVKATGYQWYWGYSYPDNGDFEVISNMLPEDEAKRRGEPEQLAVDNRMVVPAGVPLRIQVTGADVIHSFAVPSLWFKIDAVPGRLNERVLTIEKPGVYYGQCSELCGARHAYMPIAVEALPMPQWRAWIRAQGGTFKDEAAPVAAPSVAPTQDPESAVPGAAGAGAPPTTTTAPVAPGTPTPAA